VHPAEYLAAMKTLSLVVMLLLLFAGGGFCLGGSGGGLMGLILLNCIGLQLTGGFRMQSLTGTSQSTWLAVGASLNEPPDGVNLIKWKPKNL
jgi:hypothetical protein